MAYRKIHGEKKIWKKNAIVIFQLNHIYPFLTDNLDRTKPISIGKMERKIIPRHTKSIFFLIHSTSPNIYPASVKLKIQRNPPKTSKKKTSEAVAADSE
jgi:hypothetical protein